jgi:hypothetical protein
MGGLEADAILTRASRSREDRPCGGGKSLSGDGDHWLSSQIVTRPR